MKNTEDKERKLYSKELSNLIEEVKKYSETEAYIPVITMENFVAITLLTQRESLMYKVLNSVISSYSITAIVDSLMRLHNEAPTLYTNPGTHPKLDVGTGHYFKLAERQAEKEGCEFITSDHLLLAIMKEDGSSIIKDAVENQGGTYEMLFKSSIQLHEVLDDMVADNAEKDDVDKKAKKNKKKAKDEVDKVLDAKPVKNLNVMFCDNLNGLSKIGVIDKLIGRKDEIAQMQRVLARKKNNNILLVGKSGSGKTALVSGLADMIANGTGPISLLNKTIFSLKLTALNAGTTLRGMMQERIIKVFKDLLSVGNAILFIDDIHTFVGGDEEANVMPHILSCMESSNIPVIFSSTEAGVSKLRKVSPSAIRKFQRIDVPPMSFEESEKVVKGLVPSYESFHSVEYSDEVISECIRLSDRYITERTLPSSAIDILDEMGAYKKIEVNEPQELKDAMLEIARLRNEVETEFVNGSNERVEELNNEIDQLRAGVNTIVENIGVGEVTMDDLYKVMSKHTGVPISKINVSEKKHLSGMEERIKTKVVGQDSTIDEICMAVKRNKIGFKKKNGPILSAFFIGSSGCGKTYTAKKLAEDLFDDEKMITRFDMSEYSDKTSINKLIGTGAGYIGYENGGLLTNAVRNKKHTVLLFDEIEKADPGVYNVLLQVLDEGFLTDNTGDRVDFKNTIIIFTSNIGVKRAESEKSIGFVKDENVNTKDIITKELKNQFPPEFLNRVDGIFYFNNLTDDNIRTIIKKELDEVVKSAKVEGYTISYEDSVIEFIFKDVESERSFGARPIIRSIAKNVEDNITDAIIRSEDETAFNVKVVDDKIVVENVVIETDG